MGRLGQGQLQLTICTACLFSLLSTSLLTQNNETKAYRSVRAYVLIGVASRIRLLFSYNRTGKGGAPTIADTIYLRGFQACGTRCPRYLRGFCHDICEVVKRPHFDFHYCKVPAKRFKGGRGQGARGTKSSRRQLPRRMEVVCTTNRTILKGGGGDKSMRRQPQRRIEVLRVYYTNLRKDDFEGEGGRGQAQRHIDSSGLHYKRTILMVRRGVAKSAHMRGGRGGLGGERAGRAAGGRRAERGPKKPKNPHPKKRA